MSESEPHSAEAGGRRCGHRVLEMLEHGDRPRDAEEGSSCARRPGASAANWRSEPRVAPPGRGGGIPSRTGDMTP